MLAILQGKRPPQPVHPTFTKELWVLMKHCWDSHPHLRPEASEVLQALPTHHVPPVTSVDGSGQLISQGGPWLKPTLLPTSSSNQLSLTKPTALQQLLCLDSSSSLFHTQLGNVLHSETYKQSVLNLQGDDLVLLVDYLDKVCSAHPSLAFYSSQHRLLVVSILLAPVSKNVYRSLEAYVVPG